MSITLQKSNGDLYIDPETGRPQVVSGPTKVDQELADLYLSEYDVNRNWGSSLNLAQLGMSNSSMDQARNVMFIRLQQANDRIIAKQSADKSLDASETITGFSMSDVVIDYANQAVVFFSAADVGGATSSALIGQSLKPTSLMQVIAPPANSSY